MFVLVFEINLNGNKDSSLCAKTNGIYFLGRAIVFGPPGNTKGPLLFFVVSMLFWGYPMYVFRVSKQIFAGCSRRLFVRTGRSHFHIRTELLKLGRFLLVPLKAERPYCRIRKGTGSQSWSV